MKVERPADDTVFWTPNLQSNIAQHSTPNFQTGRRCNGAIRGGGARGGAGMDGPGLQASTTHPTHSTHQIESSGFLTFGARVVGLRLTKKRTPAWMSAPSLPETAVPLSPGGWGNPGRGRAWWCGHGWMRPSGNPGLFPLYI